MSFRATVPIIARSKSTPQGYGSFTNRGAVSGDNDEPSDPNQSDLSAAVILGSMPDPVAVLLRGTLLKLTVKFDWKPMHAELTGDALFLARTDEDRVLRDMIPLHEILEVRKRSDLPTGSTGSTSANALRLLVQDDGNVCGCHFLFQVRFKPIP